MKEINNLHRNINNFAEVYDEINTTINELKKINEKTFMQKRRLSKLLNQKQQMDAILPQMLEEMKKNNSANGFQVLDDNQIKYPRIGGLKYLVKINSRGYMSESFGNYFKQLFDSGKYDIHIHKGHSMNKDSILNNGLHVNGVNMMGGHINLDNTTKKCNSLFDFVSKLKNVDIYSEGFKPTDGVYIVAIPKGLDESSILIKDNMNGLSIDPKYILGFVLSIKGVVGELETRTDNLQYTSQEKDEYDTNHRTK